MPLSFGSSVVVEALDAKDAVRAATTGPIANLSACPILQDGVALVEGDRLLVKNGASADGIELVSARRNGIYLVGPVAGGLAAMERTIDANTDADITQGTFIPVASGTTNGKSAWLLVTPDPILLDSSDLTFEILAGAGAAGGEVKRQTNHIISVAEEVAGQFALPFTPATQEGVSIRVAGGGTATSAHSQGVTSQPDFAVLGNLVKFNASSSPPVALTGRITAGDELIVEAPII